jgi:glycosyltransferase involved in cell wall biosynthesis
LFKGTESPLQKIKTPTITVAIPVFNGEKEIADAIQSVLNQTFMDFELVIIDDCSADRTLDIALSFSDPRIRIIRNDVNLGYIGNFNRSVSEAKGEYLKILCHDDVIVPTCLEIQLKPFLESQGINVSISTGLKKVVNNNHVEVFRPQGLKGSSRCIDGSSVIRKCVRAGRNLIGETSVTLVKTEELQKIGSFETKYTLDLNMWFRVLQLGDLYFTNEIVSEFRIIDTSGTAAQSKTQALQTNQLLEWAFQQNFGVTKFDIRVGKTRAYLNQFARRLIFSYANRKTN